MEHVAMIRKESAPGGRQDAQGHGTMGVTRCDGCQKCQNMIALKSLKSLLLKEQGGLGPARTMFFIEFLKSFFVSLLLLAPFGVE